MGELKAVVLAAGEGTRMKSALPKVLHRLWGQPMLAYVTGAAREAGANRVCVVVGHGGEAVEAAFAEAGVTFAVQEPRRGTGHAVMQARAQIEPADTVLVLYGDTPLLRGETLRRLVEAHQAAGNSATVVAAVMDDPTGYGRIVRDRAGDFAAIVEQKDATEAQKAIRETNTGVYCFRGADLLFALDRLTDNNAQHEYYLTDALGILRAAGRPVGVMPAADAGEFAGVNDRVQLARAGAVMRQRILEGLMQSGVTVTDPSSTYVDAGVAVGRDTVLLPGTMLEGSTRIGENCVIGPHSRLTDTTVADGVTFQTSTALEAQIGPDCVVGPYAYLRPHTVLERKVKVGDFVEIKNSRLGEGTKANHLTYIGDADVGCRVNFGCGTVVVNYDGVKKHRTTIGDDCFIGCNTNLVAPVTVEDRAYTAAGSTITERVEAGSLAIARAKQVNKAGWVKKNRESVEK